MKFNMLTAVLFSFFSIASAQGADQCVLQMDDSLNKFSVKLSIRTEWPYGHAVYRLTDKFGSEKPYSIWATFRDDTGKLDSDAATPRPTREELMKRYPEVVRELYEKGTVVQNRMLTWSFHSSQKECSELDVALIIFFVHEWFYYG